jgi:hypothetical protein
MSDQSIQVLDVSTDVDMTTVDFFAPPRILKKYNVDDLQGMLQLGNAEFEQYKRAASFAPNVWGEADGSLESFWRYGPLTKASHQVPFRERTVGFKVNPDQYNGILLSFAVIFYDILYFSVCQCIAMYSNV